VVVKVLRPGVEALIATDLDAPSDHVLHERALPRMRRAITTILREFAAIAEEMDFRQEACNASLIGPTPRRPASGRTDRRREFTRQRVLVLSSRKARESIDSTTDCLR
jgi:hypothetical protein